MRTIRASEIGTFLYCRRAWWFQSQGVLSQNQTELAGGTTYHRQHGRTIFRSNMLRMAGWILLLLAIVLLAISLTLQLLG